MTIYLNFIWWPTADKEENMHINEQTDVMKEIKVFLSWRKQRF